MDISLKIFMSYSRSKSIIMGNKIGDTDRNGVYGMTGEERRNKILKYISESVKPILDEIRDKLEDRGFLIEK